MSDEERDAAHERDYADDALRGGYDDELARAAFAASVADLIDRVGSGPSSTVLSIVGDWGLGKTTILNAVEARLRGDSATHEWIICEFNPWYFSDLPSLQTGFFRHLAAALPAGRGRRKARNALADFAETVAPLGAIGGLASIDGTGIVERLADVARGEGDILKTKAAVERALAKVDRPVLVVIDDIDRLDPDELVLLFKLIRLVGRLDNVHYLLACDEDTLIGALSETGLIGRDSRRRAVDYMEKIVQVRLDVPPVRPDELRVWVDREVGRLAARSGTALDTEAEERFSLAYHGHIRGRLRTPRSVKRFFA